jgi:glycopeptide antibiotics resistance protein
MSAYLEPIRQGIFVFPFIGMLLSVPFMIRHYRKYGSLSGWFLLLNYSFILYIVCAYFMTILPLPSYETVAKMTGPEQNLKPFTFVTEFIKYNPIMTEGPKAWKAALTAPTFIQPFFNFLLTVPFGFYLRYHFKTSTKKAWLYSFLLTLSFEGIQRSALFGLYPRPYRLFDVDDLLINTLGSMFGYWVTGKLQRFLPTKAQIEEKAASRSSRVSLMRRLIALAVDGAIFTIILVVVPFSAVPSAILAFLITIILPELVAGKTAGLALVRLKLVNRNHTQPSWGSLIIRNLLGNLLFFSMVTLEMWFLNETGIVPEDVLGYYSLAASAGAWIILGFLLSLILTSFGKSRSLWFEEASGTELISTFKKGNLA